MGFQGSLASVNLGDIFQTIAMNRQTGTLVVKTDGLTRHIWFENGEIVLCDGANKTGQPILLDILQRRGLINQGKRNELQDRLYQTGQLLRDLIVASNAVSVNDLDETCAAYLEEQVCEIFEWRDGDFSFIDGDPIDELCVLEIVEAGEIRLQTAHVVMEAVRRVDEWEQIRSVIPNPEELYVVDNEGRANLRNIESDPEVLKVLRYLDGRHPITTISEHIGIPRFDTFAIVANLVINNIARARNAQEILDDGLALRKQGEKEQARDLLEAAAVQIDLPDILRPLAELSLELDDPTRAIELYLTLIERAQDDGDSEQALSDIDVVIDINPDDPDIQLDRAEILIEMNRMTEASDAFIRAAENYLSSRDIKLAIDVCHRAKDLTPTSPAPHRYLAQAYLLDDQSENAVIEYKSLWHVLLSHHRPRRALEEITTILEQDCKFPRIKEEVLQHAGGSEAVKTSAATRALIYVLMVLIVIGAAGGGWVYWQDQIKAKLVRKDLNQLETEAAGAEAELDYEELFRRLADLTGRTTNSDVHADITVMQSKIKKRFEDRGNGLAESIKTALEAKTLDATHLKTIKHDLLRLNTQYRNTEAAHEQYTNLQILYKEKHDEIKINAPLQRISNRYNNTLDWQGAIAELEGLLDNADWSEQVKQEKIKPTLDRWLADQRNAEFFFFQAKNLELKEQSERARQVYELAIKAEGDHFKAEARKALVNLEAKTLTNMTKRIEDAVKQGDVDQTFNLVEELKRLTETAQSDPVRKALPTITLPFTVSADHHLITLTLTDAKGKATKISAPPGHKGAWQHTIRYPVPDTVRVEGSRLGFLTDEIIVTAADKRLGGKLDLQRGPSWQQRLDGVPITTPVMHSNLLLTCTDYNTLAIVDAGLGSVRPIAFGNGVETLSNPPFIYENVAHLSLAGQIHAVDIATRRKLWSYPPAEDLDVNSFGKEGVWIQEHELIPGQSILTTGAGPIRGGLNSRIVTFALEEGEIIRYPDTEIVDSVTGPPLIHHSRLYIPTTANLKVFDSTSVDKNQSLQELYTFKTRGEIHQRPLLAEVYGKEALLLTDLSGAIVALDIDPNIDLSARSLAVWPLGGVPNAAPSFAKDQGIAYVSLSDEGTLVALNLGDKRREPVLWRYPTEGRIGQIIGSPAVGKNAVYITDEVGMLYAVGFNGKELWRADLGSGASTGVLAHQGRLFVGTRGKDLLCFEEGEE